MCLGQLACRTAEQASFAKLLEFYRPTTAFLWDSVRMSTSRLEWQRQFASSRKVRIAVFCAVVLFSCAFAVFLWWFAGAWVVLPFAGLEIGCVGAAFWWFEQSVDDRDRVEITGDSVTVLSYRRRRSQQTVFSRDWLSTELCCDGVRGARRPGLRLRQSGRSIEMLEFLSVPEQHRALQELRGALAAR